MNTDDAEALLWIEGLPGGEEGDCEPDDWYEALSVLMAERAPA